jgi:hypothetical protein
MILGGGGPGEAHTSAVHQDGPDLPQGTGCLNTALTSDDRVLTTGGPARATTGAKGASTSCGPSVTTPPDDRIAAPGSNPIFADRDNSRPGSLSQRTHRGRTGRPGPRHDVTAAVRRSVVLGPEDPALAPGGGYPFSVIDRRGTPSRASSVRAA